MLGDTIQPPQTQGTINTKSVDVDPQEDPSEDTQARRALVKDWIKRIKDAKVDYAEDFERIRDNMDFVAGFQWDGQTQLTSENYVVNMTIKSVNQRVATLYARDPKVEATRKPRMEFQIWDGKMETVQQAFMALQESAMTGQQPPMEAVALLQDFQHGRSQELLADKVGKTLELAYMHQQNQVEPNFKVQMKQLVRRISVCGVGYVKTSFCRETDHEVTHSETKTSEYDRAMEAQRILGEVEDGEITKTDAEIEKLKQLVASLDMAPDSGEGEKYKERLVFDFPQATAIIPDKSCRMLRGFVGARWIAEEFKRPLDFVNSHFDKDIEASDLQVTDAEDKDVAKVITDKDNNPEGDVTFWEIRDLDTKSTFVVCDGYKDYLRLPEVVSPCVKNFWQITPFLFNDVEVESECKASIFPPSDVDLIRHPQKEWNRCRNSLRRHRIANRPRGMYPQGSLHEDDLAAIANSDENEMIGLKGLAPGMEPGKVLQPLLLTPMDPALYDTSPIQEDILLGTGAQEANIGPAQPNVTATVGTIAEQSRIGVANSDIDGLDDSLSDVARCGAELLLREMSKETVVEIVGPGATWPEENRQPFIDGIELSVVAASSGRPNKALEISNWERLVPLIIQAVSMPPQAQPTIQAIIRETIRRSDDNLNPADFYPLPVPILPQETPQGSSPQGAQPKKPKPTPVNAAGQSVPMMG